MFGNIFKRSQISELSDAIESLQVSIAMMLILKYGQHNKKIKNGEEVVLANCVLSYATLMRPQGREAQEYATRYSSFVLSVALKLQSYPDVAIAVRYLYAALTIFLALKTKNPMAAVDLIPLSDKLSLPIPTSYEICGTGNGVDCIPFIVQFSIVLKNNIRK